MSELLTTPHTFSGGYLCDKCGHAIYHQIHTNRIPSEAAPTAAQGEPPAAGLSAERETTFKTHLNLVDPPHDEGMYEVELALSGLDVEQESESYKKLRILRARCDAESRDGIIKVTHGVLEDIETLSAEAAREGLRTRLSAAEAALLHAQKMWTLRDADATNLEAQLAAWLCMASELEACAHLSTYTPNLVKDAVEQQLAEAQRDLEICGEGHMEEQRVRDELRQERDDATKALAGLQGKLGELADKFKAQAVVCDSNDEGVAAGWLCDAERDVRTLLPAKEASDGRSRVD